MQVRRGNPYPLGATWDGRSGVNFAVYSEHATGVELCLVGATGIETRLRMRERTAFVWHCFVEDVQPGQIYAYRVHGPWAPHEGLRFNPRNLLTDPYAKAFSGVTRWEAGAFAYDLERQGDDRDLFENTRESRGAWSASSCARSPRSACRRCRRTSPSSARAISRLSRPLHSATCASWAWSVALAIARSPCTSRGASSSTATGSRASAPSTTRGRRPRASSTCGCG